MTACARCSGSSEGVRAGAADTETMTETQRALSHVSQARGEGGLALGYGLSTDVTLCVAVFLWNTDINESLTGDNTPALGSRPCRI